MPVRRRAGRHRCFAVPRQRRRPARLAARALRTLEVTPQAARRTVLELDLREMTGTGRGRFRAWGALGESIQILRREVCSSRETCPFAEQLGRTGPRSDLLQVC
ncbi:helix-turn-helix domain-containing protein [Ensifer sp. Root31]|uniref:helix-turn-helix domain-containing protein n=1 Tax=Ensifer sp. Root31 TaxID=1736512 RepID=UPI00244EDB7E|nr:helix-turn-helix domain-containing protein [Ensifer sp. Root31]